MRKKRNRGKLIAVGGGEFGESGKILDEFLKHVKKKRDARLTILTVATNEPDGAVKKYNFLFRKHKIKHVLSVDVSKRGDAFETTALQKVRDADALYFTGGDQLNVTSLLGGSPLQDIIFEKHLEGCLIAGTSAGAAMMSGAMIISGDSESPPRVGCIEIAPGLDLIPNTIIDTHFSQRGRHGRLFCALAHHPQNLCIGIDMDTAIVLEDRVFRVVGAGVVTVMDGSRMTDNDLPYRRRKETIGLSGVKVHVLRSGYKFDLGKRKSSAPDMKMLARGT